MEPSNKQERITAIKKFTGIYFISLLFPLVASFFMFSKPGGALKEENEKLREEAVTQGKLLAKVDSFNTQFIRLHELDKTIIQIGNDTSQILQRAEAARLSEEIEAGLKDAIRSMRKDTIVLSPGVNRTLARNMLHSFESMLVYRSTIGSLRDGLGSNTELSKKLEVANEKSRQLEKDLDILKSRPEDRGNNSSSLISDLNVLNTANAALNKENQKLNIDYRVLSGQLNSAVKDLNDCRTNAANTKNSSSSSPSAYNISSDDLKNISLIAEAESFIKLADPTIIVSNDKQRMKNANSASQIIGIIEKSTNADIRAKAKQQREQLNRVVQDIKRSVN